MRQDLDFLVSSMPPIVTAADASAHINAGNGLADGEIPNAGTTYGWREILLAMRRAGFRSTLWLERAAKSSVLPPPLVAGFCRDHI